MLRSNAKTAGSSLRRAASIGLLATGLVAASVGSAHAAGTPGPGGPGHGGPGRVTPDAGRPDFGSPDFGAPGRGTPRTETPVPSKLRPPAGNVLAGVFSATGVQVYTCKSGKWEFLEPVATLTNSRTGGVEAIHFRGPSWQSTTDGSLVVASAVENDPVTGSIPLLLLKATDNRGDGLFGDVTYIQRLATSGGAQPTGGCKDGETEGVPYRAQYRFFVEK